MCCGSWRPSTLIGHCIFSRTASGYGSGRVKSCVSDILRYSASLLSTIKLRHIAHAMPPRTASTKPMKPLSPSRHTRNSSCTHTSGATHACYPGSAGSDGRALGFGHNCPSHVVRQGIRSYPPPPPPSGSTAVQQCATHLRAPAA